MDFARRVINKKRVQTPVFLLAVHQKLVKQEENPLLYVSSGNLQEDAVHEHLRACICDIGALRTDMWAKGQTDREWNRCLDID